MAKKIKIEGEVVEQTKNYKVIKEAATGEYVILSKFDDSMYRADAYKIIGYAVLQDENGSKHYWNLKNWQLHGQGKHKCYVIVIDSWETTNVDGKEETKIKFVNERGNKFVRFIDEEGNLYKKQKEQIKVTESEDVASL